VRPLDWPAASALLRRWGYGDDGGWPRGASTQSFSAHQEQVMPSAIPHRAGPADRRLLAEGAAEFARAAESAEWLAMPGRCGQTHHLEDESPIDPAAAWAPAIAAAAGLAEPFAGGLVFAAEELEASLPALAAAAFAAQADLKLVAAERPLMIGFCHDGDLHFESSDLDLLRALRSRALELGLYTDPPDDWP
jgi:hypothetical protein